MAQRWRPSDELRALQVRQAELRQELAQLSASKRTLLLRNALLSIWCETLSHIQLMGGTQQPDDMAFEATGGRYQQPITKETQLLQQLASTEGSLDAHVSLEQLLQPDSSTFTPCTQPMAHQRLWACQTPLETTLAMDGQALASLYRCIVQPASMKLHQLKTATPGERTGLIKQLADLWIPYMRCQFDLIVAGKVDVIEAAITTNMETMQIEPAAAAKHQQAQAAAVVPLLQLTERQQEIIPIAVKLYYDLLAVVHKERQEINSEMTAVLEAERDGKTTTTTAAAAVAAAADSCAAGPATSRTQEQDLADRWARLQQQQQLTDRLALLLDKEYKLRLTAMGWFAGTLTAEQLSRIAVVSWPYGLRLLFFAAEILQQAGTPASTSFTTQQGSPSQADVRAGQSV